MNLCQKVTFCPCFYEKITKKANCLHWKNSMSNFVESPEKFAGFHLQRRTSCEPFRVCVCKYCTCVHLLSCHISTIRHGSTHTRRTFQKRFIGTYTVWKIMGFYSQPFFDENSVKMTLEEKSWCGLISRNIWEWMRILSFCTAFCIPHTVWKNEKVTLTWSIFRENNLQSK